MTVITGLKEMLDARENAAAEADVALAGLGAALKSLEATEQVLVQRIIDAEPIHRRDWHRPAWHGSARERVARLVKVAFGLEQATKSLVEIVIDDHAGLRKGVA